MAARGQRLRPPPTSCAQPPAPVTAWLRAPTAHALRAVGVCLDERSILDRAAVRGAGAGWSTATPQRRSQPLHPTHLRCCGARPGDCKGARPRRACTVGSGCAAYRGTDLGVARWRRGWGEPAAANTCNCTPSGYRAQPPAPPVTAWARAPRRACAASSGCDAWGAANVGWGCEECRKSWSQHSAVSGCRECRGFADSTLRQ